MNPKVQGAKPAIPTGPAPAILPGQGGGTASRGPQQVSPARSAMDLAARALNASRRLHEAGLNNVHSSKLHAVLRGDRRNDALLARAFVGKLAKSLLANKDPRIEQLLQQFGDIDDVDSLFAAIERSELHPAAMALLLAAMAQQHRPGRKRSRLEEALERRLGASGDWELAMLGWLEFGAMTPELMSQLKSLYQRAGVVQQGMAAFLDQLAGIGERRRKVKVLIRALGAELSGIEDDAAEGIKLAAVVRDLKRLLVFLGCEEQCGRIARALGEPPVEPDTVLRLLIRMVDQPWLYHDWIRGEIEGMQLGRERGFKLARDITRLAKLLPEPCFRDDDHRQQVLTALNEFNDRAENADPAEGDATG
ncbi:TyeA family type III secretion system gatekeeper subunit [Cupriavidus gilardii]|uniref:TyeA family type III secretion system gatekeeper subunit n=1 Tax=Cupriavidus gilardii TaxID=82541 RepID=UPI0015800780|nr:TyeA family type III secretion system gatekeeper subunit [Cupriavidus gilardii]MCT9070537.1 TyeA family type III secretion system gatekeeper subunit [Cupriavidus gilardii]QKS61092.1 TyeA family type III secretion system gatekeeper subunit [Cupriavidus gilardii]